METKEIEINGKKKIIVVKLPDSYKDGDLAVMNKKKDKNNER